MDKQAKFKFIGSLILTLMLFALLVGGLQTYLDSPADNFEDDDGYLDLRGRCEPTSVNEYDGTTSYNITKAVLYSDVSGTWQSNYTLNISNQSLLTSVNTTFFFNFTNHINKTAEGTFQWGIECFEENASSTKDPQTSSFTANRTIVVKYANPSMTTASPEDGVYDFDGHEISVSCEGSPTSGWNITQIELMTTIDGTWIANQTHSVASTTAGISKTFTINKFGNSSIADGTDLIYSCRGTQYKNLSGSNNEAVVTSTFSSENQTINIDYPPTIRLNSPADASWTNAADDLFNFTVNSSYTSGTNFFCQQWSNGTGTWAVSIGSFNVINSTPYTFRNQLLELSDVRWGIRCQEGGDANVGNFSINRTLRIDRTDPAVSLDSPSTGNYFSSIPNITYTLTELHTNSCSLFVNDTLNITERTVFTNFTITDAVDGVYSAIVGCNDTANNRVNSSSTLFILDTTFPAITGVGNLSVSGSADKRFFNFSADEDVNVTIFYGTTVGVTSNQINSTFHKIQNMTIGGFEENTQYFWNITACDRAGNCNNTGASLGQFDFTFPWKLLTGWSYYGVWDSKINFSDILDATESEFVYYWNQTNQEWVFATSGGSSNMNFEVGISTGTGRGVTARHVVVIFEEVNSTWDRNTTNSGYYHYNITTGDNFIKLPTDYSFGNFSNSLLNSSFTAGTVSGYRLGVTLSQTPGNTSQIGSFNAGGLVYNMTEFWFSAYNNTGVTWEPYWVYNQTAENNTVLTIPGPHEVMWMFAEDNLTWNSTNVVGNWTI